MFCNNSCKKSHCLEWDQYSNTTQNAILFTIGSIALAGIAMATVGLLAYGNVISGINATAQWALIGVGLSFIALACVGAIVAQSAMKTVELIHEAPQELRERIEQFCDSVRASNDPLGELHELAKKIPLDDLQQLIKADYPKHKGALKTAQNMLGEAKFYMSATHSATPSFKARLLTLGDRTVSVIDSILAAFGIAEFFKPADGDLHADFKFQKITMLISLFTLLTATLLPMFGVETGASIVGGTLVGIALLSLIWPKIRPMVSRLPEGENWTRQAQMKQLQSPTGREGALDQIAQALQEGKHPIIYGASGVGKTQTVQAFVEALEAGKYPELQGKKVFYFNTASLVASFDMFGKNNTVLKRIYDALGEHRDNCILVFDEIHVAFQDTKAYFGDKLKTYLDVKPENSFPHVIGLTTAEEYYRYIFTGQPAIDRRYEAIHIADTNEDETLSVLYQELLQKVPQAIVEFGVLKKILEATQKGPQPLAAKKILASCIERVTHQQKTPLSSEIELLKSQRTALYAEGVLQSSKQLKTENSRYRQVAKIDKKLAALEKEVSKEEEKLKQLDAVKSQLALVRQAKFQTVLDVNESGTDKTKLKELLLMKYFLEQSLENYLQSHNESLMPTVIDEKLVQEVIQEKAANQKKKEGVLAQGKQQHADRQALS